MNSYNNKVILQE